MSNLYNQIQNRSLDCNRYLAMETLILSAQIPPNPLRRTSPHRRPQSLRFRRHIVAAAENLSSETTQISEPKPKSENRMFILRMGFVGRFIAADLKKKGWDIQGTCRSTRKKEMFEKRGYGAHFFDPDFPRLSTLKNAIKGCTHLLVSGPVRPEVGDLMLQQVEFLRREIKNGDLKWLCYLSTTSVYGDHGGAWVDEDSPTNPETESAKLTLAAEEGWLKLGHGLGLSSFAFRVGDIYGPGKSPVNRIIEGGGLMRSDEMRLSRQYASRVHVEDICQALEASILKPSDRNVYNIVDDNPAPPVEVYPYAQDLVSKKWRSLVRPPIPFLAERNTGVGKRVSNTRMKNELGVSLRYPSYVEGLQSIIDQIEEPTFY